MGRPQLYSPRQPDSPSKQLMLELARDLEQVRLHNTELKKVRAYERRSFYEKLDRLDQEKEEVHNAALTAAAAKRDALRLEAERTLQHHLLVEEEERNRKAELERQRKEKAEREKAERERREREEAARVEAEKRAQEEEKRRKAEEAEMARRAEEEEKAKQERERAAREQKQKERQRVEQEEAKAKAAAEEKRKQAEQAQAPSATTTTASSEISGAAHRTPQQIAEHQRYLELHQHLKKFRKYMVAETKTNPILKQHMGDMRRTIKKCVGQLVADDKVANRTPTNQITTVLKQALTLSEPSVDIRQFLAFPPTQLTTAPESQTKAPALLIYLLNIFSKAIIAQLIAEAGITPKYAEPLGVLTAQIFSMDAFLYNGISLIDILFAKYHALCPVLWGFYGNEQTASGKITIGWWRDEAGNNGKFVSPQTHEERMIGLGAGFAAISLRNFSKTPRRNPVPNTHFWRAVATIVNTPAQEVQDTHFIVLSALLRHSAPRIVGFWGDAGLALLRRAIVEFPAATGEGRKGAARATVEILREVFVRERCILL
ncbi:hypothetical protein AJ79_06187 [Helicocarpus griseus UAMH5409]|uniref:mRNA export factor GLE1 n=1 Tax=Helicocarpus griseus UAMH5409 TaxID=1447875 RepID=A0A2B7XFK8_9EURO|nr:hypothetical protein AJ79_06187 [Helicocarpus griseus UAMH5409]